MSPKSKDIVLYFQVHQPYRIKPYSIFEVARDHDYFTDQNHTNQHIFEKVASKSYRPMNKLVLKLLNENPNFKVTYSLSGVFLEQALNWAPDLIDDFREMVATGRVELLAETYYHSLAYFYNKDEFEAQVIKHTAFIQELFGVTPTAFRGTELSYNNSVGQWAGEHGFKAVLAEGWEKNLDWRSPNYVYKAPGSNASLFLRNYKLSDDIAFRFSNTNWSDFPLTARKFSDWADKSLTNRDVLNLFMDYETFGEHHWEETGIFKFFSGFVTDWCNLPSHGFLTVTEASNKYEAVDEIDIPDATSWADAKRDLSAWLGNSMQHQAGKALYEQAEAVQNSNDEQLKDDWRKLQTSDNLYYLFTSTNEDGKVHDYFSPHPSPYDAFIYYMNTIRDINARLKHYGAN